MEDSTKARPLFMGILTIIMINSWYEGSHGQKVSKGSRLELPGGNQATRIVMPEGRAGLRLGFTGIFTFLDTAAWKKPGNKISHGCGC